jgi:hypothetical protein
MENNFPGRDHHDGDDGERLCGPSFGGGPVWRPRWTWIFIIGMALCVAMWAFLIFTVIRGS